MTMLAGPAPPAATVNDTRWWPVDTRVAVLATALRPGCLKVTTGLVDSGSIVVNRTVSVWPAATVVADRATEKASTTIERRSVVVPSPLTAVSTAV